MRKLSHQEIVERQKGLNKVAKIPFVVVLNNIRSLYNVGSIFRTADGAGVRNLYLCGITGHPPNSQISKTALGAEENVPWEYHEDVYSLLERLKKDKYQILLLEQTKDSRDYDKIKPNFPVCLVLGNEIDGVNEKVLSFCDQAVEIEMAGLKNSLNVSVAFGIIAYRLRSLFLKKE